MKGYITKCEKCEETKMQYHISDHPKNPKSSVKIRRLKCVGCGRVLQTDEVQQITKP